MKNYESKGRNCPRTLLNDVTPKKEKNMAKVDLSSFAWCDLVFSGKNKAYGAYKMRETSPRRHNIAMILVIVIALIGFSIPTLIKWLPQTERGDDRSDYLSQWKNRK